MDECRAEINAQRRSYSVFCPLELRIARALEMRGGNAK